MIEMYLFFLRSIADTLRMEEWVNKHQNLGIKDGRTHTRPPNPIRHVPSIHRWALCLKKIGCFNLVWDILYITIAIEHVSIFFQLACDFENCSETSIEQHTITLASAWYVVLNRCSLYGPQSIYHQSSNRFQKLSWPQFNLHSFHSRSKSESQNNGDWLNTTIFVHWSGFLAITSNCNHILYYQRQTEIRKGFHKRTLFVNCVSDIIM